MKNGSPPCDEGSFDHGSSGTNPRTYRKGNRTLQHSAVNLTGTRQLIVPSLLLSNFHSPSLCSSTILSLFLPPTLSPSFPFTLLPFIPPSLPLFLPSILSLPSSLPHSLPFLLYPPTPPPPSLSIPLQTPIGLVRGDPGDMLGPTPQQRDGGGSRGS